MSKDKPMADPNGPVGQNAPKKKQTVPERVPNLPKTLEQDEAADERERQVQERQQKKRTGDGGEVNPSDDESQRTLGGQQPKTNQDRT